MEVSSFSDCIVDRYLEQVKYSPTSIAISYKSYTLSYSQLKTASLYVAQDVARFDVGITKRVAIIAERCPALVTAILGVALAGGSFIVLDSAYPDQRLGQLLDICAPALILAAGDRSGLKDRCGRLAQARAIPLLESVERAPDGFQSEDCRSQARGGRGVSALGPAYYLFTSGSTGMPKCVAVSHAPLMHFVDWHASTSGLSSDDRFSLVSGLSHDPVLRDIFTPLSIGARLEIPSQETIAAPGQLRRWFADRQITVAHLTPSMGRLLLAQGRSGPELGALRRAFWGGEQLTPDVVAQLGGIAPKVKQTNFYGCTETPQAICYHDIDPGLPGGRLPIGKPVDGFELHIAGEDGAPAPVGVIGEVCVKSPFLSLGYVSQGRIVSDHASGVYRTGDFGTMDAAGAITLSGRRDDQVKIRGYRVDLSEVDAGLRSIAGVLSSVTLPIEDASGQRIEAFVHPDPHHALDNDGLRTLMAARVPSYMVPARCHVLPDGLPLLPNGKIDRQALRRLAGREEQTKPDVGLEASSPQEAAFVARWAEIFPGRKVTPASSFKSLGGDSLSYVQAYLAGEELVGALPTDWANRPIAQLAGTPPRKTSRFWADIDSTIVIRCAAILMIVGYHFGVCPPGYGLTGAFFLISGHIFGTLKFPTDLRTFEIGPSLAATWRIFLPTLFFVLFVSALHLAAGQGLPLPVFLFYADLIDYPSQAARGTLYGGHEIVFWYVHCLLQMILIVVFAAFLVKRLSRGPVTLAGFALALFVAGLFCRFVLPPILDPTVLGKGLEDLSFFQLASISNLATFALGLGLSAWARQSRWAVLTILLLYSVVDAWFYGFLNGLWIAVTGTCLLYLPSLPVPRFLSPAIREIAAGALFIYLSQFLLAAIMNKIFGAHVPAAQIFAAIAGGLVVYKLWCRAERVLRAVNPTSIRPPQQAARQSC